MKVNTKFRMFFLAPLLAAGGTGAILSGGMFYSAAARSDGLTRMADADKPSEAGKTAGVTARPSLVTFPPISSQLPSDIPGGAGNATITDAALFAWQEFIALNWPASPSGVSGSNTRGNPDNTKRFGDDSSGPDQANQPVVWETYRSKVETFPGVGDPPGYSNGPSQDYGFDVAPDYVYGTRSSTKSMPPLQNNPGGSPANVPACQNPSQPDVPTPAYVNLDEITQIGLDSMFAGVLPPSITNPTSQTANAQPQLIRFLAKGNRTFYDYVATNQFWYQGSAFVTAKTNFNRAAVGDQYPPTTPYIELPTGTVLVKAAWRPLAPGENASNFHTKTVRFYDQYVSAPTPTPCYREQTWALIALHIIQKTQSAPYFIFATFEYTNNILRPDGSPVEDKNGSEINAPAGDGMDPQLNYFDANGEYYSPAYPKGNVVPQAQIPNPAAPSPPAGVPLPLVQVTGPYCSAVANDRLYFQNLSLTGDPIPAANTGVCINKRYFAIPSQIQQVNAAAHVALQNYGAPALWQNYKLINVQWEPFNTGEIDTTGANTSRLVSTYSLANGVVETDNTLQEFFGGLFALTKDDVDKQKKVAGAQFVKSAFEQNDKGFDQQTPAYNIFEPPSGGTHPNHFTRYNMGGCMGCHGRAQRAGTDFSFTLAGGPVSEPEFAVPAAGTALHVNFAAGFDKNRLEKLHRALAGQ